MPTILYAEDDAGHREMMQVIFQDKEDITVVTANDGEEAVQKIRRQRPDLVLLDLFMPKLDGHGVMQAVKSDPKTKHIPIIVISAWSTGDNRKRSKIAGATNFIAKPYDPEELVSMVSALLKSKKDTNNLVPTC